MILWPKRLGNRKWNASIAEAEGEISRVGAALYLRCLINQVERTRHTAFPCRLFSLSLSLRAALLPVFPAQVFMLIHPVVIQGHNKRGALSLYLLLHSFLWSLTFYNVVDDALRWNDLPEKYIQRQEFFPCITPNDWTRIDIARSQRDSLGEKSIHRNRPRVISKALFYYNLPSMNWRV